MLTVYAYDKCSSCRDAIKWLNANGIPYQVKAIRETPPSVAEFESALEMLNGDLRKLWNTSGVDYRALGIKDLLPTLSREQALELLASNGNLVKRPFVIGKKVALTGFKSEVWAAALQSA
jgi:arsenate reductase (glutaredoxin)